VVTRGVVQNKSSAIGLYLTNQSFQTAALPVCSGSGPIHRFLEQSDGPKCVQGDTQIQSLCGEETNVRGRGVAFGQSKESG
jgi:hypothetical protein